MTPLSVAYPGTRLCHRLALVIDAWMVRAGAILASMEAGRALFRPLTVRSGAERPMGFVPGLGNGPGDVID